MMHFYAFGSICRGETDAGSDIDLLACVSCDKTTVDVEKFSVYTYERIVKLWKEGNPFAWHLHLESKLLFSSDGSDFLSSLASPSPYPSATSDCTKFHKLFLESQNAIMSQGNSTVFHLSCMFLAMRNFATCYSFATGQPVFSRRSPLLIGRRVPISEESFGLFARARILSTRGYGPPLSESEVHAAIEVAPEIVRWMERLRDLQ